MKRIIALIIATLFLCSTAYAAGKYDLDDYGYRAVKTNGRGSLVFQESPRGAFMNDHKFRDGDRIYVNLNWRQNGYAIAYEDGEFGYVDASYIDWGSSDPKDLSNFEYRTVRIKGKGSLVFQKSPKGAFMYDYQYGDGDEIFVNVDWRKDGYALAYEDGVYGYVDANYIDWGNDNARDLSDYEYRRVRINGRGSLVFQTSPRGSFLYDYKYNEGDWIYVNVNWRKDGYAIAYEDGVYGYVDASYIDWRSTSSDDARDLSNFEYREVDTDGRGSLIFQKSPRGSFMFDHSYSDGDWIYVNVDWRKDGYAIAYEDGVFGYVDASYIDW